MIRALKMAGLLACAVALAAQWIAVGERIAAAIWGWYKFRGFGGGTPMTVGRETQLVFYTLSLAFAGIALAIARTSRDSRFGTVARFETGGLVLAMVVWTVVLMSPLVAPFHSWR